jgi:predicted AAA+ superfamily ATPase
MELPLKKIKATLEDPKNLILYGVPKVGKTTLLAQLEDNLIIDTEKGSGYVDALKVEATTLEEIVDICKSVREAGNPYKFATIDTISTLEDMCSGLALKRYKKDNPDYEGTLLDIPYGGGLI